MSASAPFLRLLRGTLVAGRYQLLDPIGRGGMGMVFEAIDVVTDRLRAIKIVDGTIDGEAKVRFRREALIAGRARSSRLVEITDGGHDEALDMLFLVMERLHGRDLGVVLREAPTRRLAMNDVLEILAQVSEGLAALHDEGIVHRDLKPENVVLSGDLHSSAAIKIVDFGLAKSFVACATSPNTTRAMGTPLFMSPEQLVGDGTIDHRADIYAFGHLAFALLVGAPYFAREYQSSANLYALLQRVARGLPEDASIRARAAGVELPSGFDAWFRNATAAEPDRRFDSIDEAYRALRDAARHKGSSRSTARPTTWIALGSVAVVCVASTVGVAAFRTSERVAATAMDQRRETSFRRRLLRPIRFRFRRGSLRARASTRPRARPRFRRHPRLARGGALPTRTRPDRSARFLRRCRRKRLREAPRRSRRVAMIRSTTCKIHRWFSGSLGAIAVAFAVEAPALADEGASALDPAALALFRKGRDQIAAGDWEGGCEKLALSFARSPAASTLLNLARCDEHRGNLASAWARHHQAIPLAERIEDPVRRDELLRVTRAGILSLEARVPKLRIIVQRPARGVAVTDEKGRVVPADEDVPFDPGRHRIVAHATGYADSTLEVELSEGRTTTLAIALEPSTAEAVPALPASSHAAPRVLDRSDASSRSTDSFPWLAAGIGAAGVALGAVALGFGIDALDASSDLRDRCGADLVCDEDPAFDPDPLNERKNRGAVYAAVFGGAGAAALGVAAWMLLHRDTSAPSAPKASVVPTRSGALFTIRF